jgi:hypothetical protein
VKHTCNAMLVHEVYLTALANITIGNTVNITRLLNVILRLVLGCTVCFSIMKRSVSM